MNRGVRNTQIAISVNLLVAVLLIIGMFGGINVLIDVISNWILNIGVAITTLYLSGYIIGKRMDYNINTKKRSPILNGVIGLFLILIVGIVAGATVGFIQEGLKVAEYAGLGESIFDYYIKPLYWIIKFGFIPTLLAGIILGDSIKKDVL